jgi:UDP-glucose 4-epimerase
MSAKILVTGGAGYIGSHTCLELLNAGYHVVVLDDLSNSVEESLHRVEKLTQKSLTFYQVNLLNRLAVEAVFEQEGSFEVVIHFAGKKAVGESVAHPGMYYHNNVTGSLVLFECMQKFDVKRIVFSSSATVYGDPVRVPITEDARIQPTNPYGHSKAMVEQILMDWHHAHQWEVILLRYFNPVGAHASGEIGEDPDYPNNLVPYVSQVAAGIRDYITIFGDDYPTPDGTGIRDYIHVIDLALAHIAALRLLEQTDRIEQTQTDSKDESFKFSESSESLSSSHTSEQNKSKKVGSLGIYNIGTGRGYSVQEVISTYREVSKHPIPAHIGPRRSGDVAVCTADVHRANTGLSWQAQFDLHSMIASAWHWQSQNPHGYTSKNQKL